jgi:cell division protein FtsQ
VKAGKPLSIADDPRYLRPGGNRRVRRRRRTRTTLRALFWCLVWGSGFVVAGLGFLEGWRLLTGTDRFPLRRIIVQGGGARVDPEVSSILSPLLGRNTFSIDLGQVERASRSHPWVRAASVERRVPDGLLVVVEARSVEALVLRSDGVHMVDLAGADMGRYETAFAAVSRPVITGAGRTGSREEAAAVARGLEALGRLDEGAPEFVDRVSTIDVSRRDRIIVTLRDFLPPVYLSPEEPLRNLDRLALVRERLAADEVQADYVDLRFRDRIAVMPVRDGESKSG